MLIFFVLSEYLKDFLCGESKLLELKYTIKILWGVELRNIRLFLKKALKMIVLGAYLFEYSSQIKKKSGLRIKCLGLRNPSMLVRTMYNEY